MKVLLRSLTVILLATCFFSSVPRVSASVSQAIPTFGDLDRWAIFSLGGGVTETTDVLTGTTYIKGDVGVAGNGNITLSGNATLDGNLYYHTPGTLKLSGGAKITGTPFQGSTYDTMLNNGVTQANSSSSQAASYTTSTAYISQYDNKNISLSSNQAITLFAQHDRPGNSTVLNLNSVTLSGSAILTLSGTATDVFILNVKDQFSLSGTSQITLTGGLQWNNVLYNVKSTGSADVNINGGHLSGILMANNRTVILSGGAVIDGEVIANKVKMSGGARVNHPPITSP